MSLASRVTRLEATHKQALRCAWCRFSLSEVPPTRQKRYNVTPDIALPTKCWFCGTKYVVSLFGLNDRQREAVALIYNSQPTEQFTDERVHAAPIWFYLYR